MKKSIIGIMMAVTLVGSSLAFPVQAYAREKGENVENGEKVEEIYQGEVVAFNDGEIETNNGTVTTNNGTVTTNNGTVEVNWEMVDTNNGTVEATNGTVTTNNGTVEANWGMVDTNYGTVTENKGTVTNNYGGTVNNVDGGTVTNQWYEYILTGGIFKSGSTASKDAGDRTWIGKAESTDNKLGDYYITVAANEGAVFEYATVNGEPVSYITNADGTISFGNISSAINIFFKQLINNNNNDDENTGNTYESSADSNAANLIAAIEAVVAAEEKMPVTSFTSDEAVANIPEAAKNSGASYNLSAITTSQGFVAAVNKISENVKAQNAVDNAANNNTARRISVTVYSDKPMNFTADILNAISASDIDFVFAFMHNGKMYRVTIPRGTNVNLNGRKYEGPLFIGQILGTSEEIG